MPSQMILDKANAVADRVTPNEDGSKEFDVLAIATLLLGLVKFIKDCREKPQMAAKLANDPPLYYRRQVKRYLKDQLGREQFRRKGDELFEGILALGPDVTAEDIKQLIKESENGEASV